MIGFFVVGFFVVGFFAGIFFGGSFLLSVEKKRLCQQRETFVSAKRSFHVSK